MLHSGSCSDHVPSVHSVSIDFNVVKEYWVVMLRERHALYSDVSIFLRTARVVDYAKRDILQ